MSMFVNECLLLTVERSSTARHHTGAMLHHLVRNNLVSMSNYVQGLHEFLSLADDMVIDVPRIWQYIAELISPMLLDEKSEIPLDFLRRACSPLLSCEGGDKAALVISMVLLDAVHSLVNCFLCMSILKSDFVAVLAVLPRYPQYYRGNGYKFYSITAVLGSKYAGILWGWGPGLQY